MTKIIVFRHGETDPNVQMICQGSRIDEPLNEQGIKQAYALRDILKYMEIDVIISSPLKRAFQTASIVAEPNNTNIVINDDLKEGCMGILEGEKMEIYQNKYSDVWDARHNFEHPDYWTAKVPEMESRQEIHVRAERVLEFVKRNFPNKTVAIASHGFFMQNLYYAIFKQFKDDFKNTEFFEAEI